MVAGTGSPFLTGDGGSSLLAGLGSPTAIAVDPSGNIYIADYCAGSCIGGEGSRIREITTAGIIRTIAGGAFGFSGDGGPAISAQVSAYPSGIAIDHSGNIFISDSGNQRIRRINPSGIITTVAGNPTATLQDGVPATSSGIGTPSGLAIDANGNFYFAALVGGDSRTGLSIVTVRKVTANGLISTVYPALQTDFGRPGLAIDNGGDLYVVDGVKDAVLKISSSGVVLNILPVPTSILAGIQNSASQLGPAVDDSGSVFISVWDRLIKLNASGTAEIVAGGGKQSQGDGGPATQVSLSLQQMPLTSDSQGNIYLVGSQIWKLTPTNSPTNGCIYSIDTQTQSVSIAGGTSNVGALSSASGCPWLAISHADWIAVSPLNIQEGTGLVTYSVAANPNSATRTGTVWIAGKSLTIVQSGVTRSLGVDPKSVSVAASGLTGASLTVTSTAPDCRWTAVANVPWVLVSGGSTGTGSGAVTFTVGVNTGGLRTGAITAAPGTMLRPGAAG
jgi:hypothetical protein